MAFGRGKSNHTLARCAFFYQHCFTKIIETLCCDESPGKKIHTLVKENTQCCHKIRQKCGFTQKAAFFSMSLCFLPHCHANIGRQVRLIPPGTYVYQEIYDTQSCLNFWKVCQNVCSYKPWMLKSRCKFVMLLGKYAQQKQIGWEVIFSELGSAGSGAHKPRRELEGSALDFFCSLFWGFRGLQLCK